MFFPRSIQSLVWNLSFQPPQSAPAPAAAPPSAGSGRASHRGGARGEPRPGGDAPVAAMAAMGIGSGESGGAERSRFDYFEERVTRPDNLTDKKGKIRFYLQCVVVQTLGCGDVCLLVLCLCNVEKIS